MLLQGKRIFYIEDDINNRAIAQTILDRNGARFAFERWGGVQTLVRLNQFLPMDLILLDLMFPNNVSGYDLYDVIRNSPHFDNVPVVIVSAADPAIEMPRARKKGIAGYISKPIDVITFPRLIANFFEGQSVWVAN
jgi:CheY-like chemotaxis protein